MTMTLPGGLKLSFLLFFFTFGFLVDPQLRGYASGTASASSKDWCVGMGASTSMSTDSGTSAATCRWNFFLLGGFLVGDFLEACH